MKIADRMLWITLVCLLPVPLVAQPPATSKAPEKVAKADDAAAKELLAIRAASADFVTAFDKGDAKALAALWTEQGEYINEAGVTFSGRKAIEKEYAAFFAEHQGVHIKLAIDSIKLLSDSAAIEDGRAFVDPAPAGAPATSKYTVVHVKVGGKWLMSTVRDTHVETPSSYANIADLEFLIGTWTAEEHGAKSTSVCRWVANKSFVERTYSVTHADQTTTSGVQLIGFNPRAGAIQSWNFSSDGGHAIGLWSAQDGGWAAETTGVTGAGQLTTAVNTLKRLDDNAYVWQSTQRSVGGNALPDTEEVVMKRTKSAP